MCPRETKAHLALQSALPPFYEQDVHLLLRAWLWTVGPSPSVSPRSMTLLARRWTWSALHTNRLGEAPLMRGRCAHNGIHWVRMHAAGG